MFVTTSKSVAYHVCCWNTHSISPSEDQPDPSATCLTRTTPQVESRSVGFLAIRDEFELGKSFTNGRFPIAMFDCRRVRLRRAGSWRIWRVSPTNEALGDMICFFHDLGHVKPFMGGPFRTLLEMTKLEGQKIWEGTLLRSSWLRHPNAQVCLVPSCWTGAIEREPTEPTTRGLRNPTGY